MKSMGFKDQFGLKLEKTGEKKEGEKKRKRKRSGRSKDQSSKKVWKLTLIMNPIRFGMDLWLGRIIIVPKHGVLLGFHLNPKIMESKVGKTPHGTIWL